jgi:hypothetical protein
MIFITGFFNQVSDFDVNNKFINKKRIFEHSSVAVQREKKERNACIRFQILKHERSQRTVEQEIKRVICLSSSACVILMYARARRQRLGEFHGVWLLLFCLYSCTPFTPEYPLDKWYGSLLWLHATPSLFMCVGWTAEFCDHELAIVPNQLAKQRPPYRLFLLGVRG